MAFARRDVLRAAAGAGTLGLLGGAALELTGEGPSTSRSADWGEQSPPEPYDRPTTILVDRESSRAHDTIQAAVDAAESETLVLVSPGVYEESVTVHDTPRLTIRGADRDGVIVDAGFEGRPGITATADDVVVENLTVTGGSYGVYWSGVEGYRASHVVAYNNSAPGINGYGIYAFNSEHGRFEHCYASGSDDAGFYIGESQPAHAVITDCLAEGNAMGFSGTNAGGDFVIKDSVWRDNVVGIVPNTLDSQAGAPQGHVAGGVRIEGNEVHSNNDLTAPNSDWAHPIHGCGVAIAGGTRNDVVDNVVRNQANYGIAVTPILDDDFYRPDGNAVERNDVSGSGRVDLALAAPAGDNAFADNDFGSARPAFIERRDGSFGDPWVFLTLFASYLQTELGDVPGGDVRDQPPPSEASLDAVAAMDDPVDTPPAPAVGGR
ncbi:MAG: right-handed parallel beta-helix repeat-containing protein [Halobacteriota archaeon]